MFIAKVIIDHAPNRRLSGTRDKGDDLNCMLPVEHIVDSISATDFYRVDLVKIKISRSTSDVCLGQIALIVLI